MINKIKKRLPNRTSFKPGNPGNPKGRGTTPPILKAFREYTAKVVAEIYTDLIKYSMIELQALVDAKDTPALQVIMAQTLLRDRKNNDSLYTERILTRIIGPVPAVQELGGIGGGPLAALVQPPMIKEVFVDSPAALENKPPNG